jgi:ATP-binding cassette, subfamily C (CFTR/MRP), member 1
MVAVERLKFYSNVEMEGVGKGKEHLVMKPDAAWPSEGVVEFKNVTMRYRPELPLVLKGMSLSISRNEKVGICGRTGAGKSSIMVALLRLVDIEDGQICIDGIDTSKIGLDHLRTAVAIIPQDPVLFSGTVRFNLDPFDQYTDDDVWQALKDVQMVDRVQVDANANGLQTVVAESGSNFSVGESQLLCIARALLRKTKIVLLDEATASCDGRTDSIIQNVMKTKFEHATVLTIAHRLETIIFYDKIAVISEGKIVEFASPKELLQDKTSDFCKVINEMGTEGKKRMMAMVGL